ncbi:MAG: 3-dehydroquinate synthase family protein [Fimbriimonadaceae bacterium]
MLTEFVDPREVFHSMPAHPLIITDENVLKAWGSIFPESVPVIAIKPGEKSKTLEEFQRICERLTDNRYTRETTIMAIGGGVVGDLVGFVAATYMRGLDIIHVPTSLMAMVDSSIGNKVAVDLPAGKNLVGAFKKPVEIRLCPNFLETLPPAEVANGLAEVLKYSYIAEPSLRDYLKGWAEASVKTWHQVIGECADIKLGLCLLDPEDRYDIRAKLNFGHTVGHALEQVAGYQTIRHGEAIGIGMVVESVVAAEMGVTSCELSMKIAQDLATIGLPTNSPLLNEENAIIDAILRDKKRTSEGIALALVTEPGTCKLYKDCPESLIREAIVQVRNTCSS